MIYLIIADSNNSKGDCHSVWQPHNHLPDAVQEYIDKTNNESVKAERTLAYSTLILSLEKFFSIKNPTIVRNENGKPYIKDNEAFISLSHCDGVAAIALSDEGEIGVDIQSPPEERKAEHLSKRFLSETLVRQDKTKIKYVLLSLIDGEYGFNEISLTPEMENDFLSKWVYSESVIKAFGRTFSDISKITALSENTATQIVNYKNFKISTTIVI
jgi:phosphopantetheinyl transferase